MDEEIFSKLERIKLRFFFFSDSKARNQEPLKIFLGNSNSNNQTRNYIKLRKTHNHSRHKSNQTTKDSNKQAENHRGKRFNYLSKA